MELHKTAYIIIISLLVAIILLFAYLNLKQNSVSVEIGEELESCKSLVYNGEDRIDLLFLASESDTQRFSDALLNTLPYSENKNYFNIFFIDDYEPTCEDYKGIAILCNTKENIKEARRCPNDYIFIIKDKPSNIRSSAFGNVISINKNHDNAVIVHEFGHAFGNLAEEYTPAKLPRGSENCVSSCDKFNGPIDSCEQECSQGNLYRSIRAGVMRTLITSDYGQFNIKLLKELLEKNKPSDAGLTGNQIAEYKGCEDKQVVIVEGTQTESSFSIDAPKELLLGCAPDNSGVGAETIITDSGSELYSLTAMFTDVQAGDELTGSIESPQTILFSTSFTNNQDTLTIRDTQTGEILAQTSFVQAGATACIT